MLYELQKWVLKLEMDFFLHDIYTSTFYYMPKVDSHNTYHLIF